MTLAGLYVTRRRIELPTHYEERDARRNIAAWSQQVDKAAGSSRPWKAAIDGELDVPESL